MAQIIPADTSWQDALRSAGAAASEGYQNRADEKAIRNAVSGLGPKASARDILNAVTNTNTYSPQAKQNFLSNYMGVEKFEELKRQAQKNEAIQQEKNRLQEETLNLKRDLDAASQLKKQEKGMNDALTRIDYSDLPQDQKEALREKVKNGEVSDEAIKDVVKPSKAREKLFETEETKKTAQKAFNRLNELVPDVGVSGTVTSKLGGKTAEAYGEFTSLTGALESLLIEMVNKGTLSNTRFKYITEDLLPKPNDSQAKIKGKLKGLSAILDLESPKNQEKTTKETDSKGRKPFSTFER